MVSVLEGFSRVISFFVKKSDDQKIYPELILISDNSQNIIMED